MGDPIVSAERVNTILYCDKWRETVDFYHQGLGLAVLFSNDWFVEFELGPGASVSVADTSRSSIVGVAGQGITLSLRVADLEALRQALLVRGLSPLPIRSRFGAPVFDISDPEGHRIEFWSA